MQLRNEERDRAWLREAIEISRRAPASASAFSVGCVIVHSNDERVSLGYSRETSEIAHAEEVAIGRAVSAGADLSDCTIYSSLEPCGARLSAPRSCAQRIIESGIPRVVFALAEPALFVEAHGAQLLKSVGIDVCEIASLADDVIGINGHLLGSVGSHPKRSPNV